MAEPGGKTIAEIRTQPAVWAEVLRLVAPRPTTPALIVGCGSSYYVALAAAAVLRRAGVEATAAPASEAMLFPDLWLAGRRGLVAVSRSGETSEAIAATRVARQRGLSTLTVTCAPASTLAGLADAAVALPGAAEASLVMTRSFTTMLLALTRPAAPGDGLPEAGRRLLVRLEADAALRRLAADERFASLVYLGAGPLHGLALEGALKAQEMSLTPTVAFHPLELRHGPIALVGAHTLAVLLVGDSDRAACAALSDDLRARGATVLAIAERGDGLAADHVVELSSGLDEWARLPLVALPLQLLGYHRALARAIDCDAPATLSRYVQLDLEEKGG